MKTAFFISESPYARPEKNVKVEMSLYYNEGGCESFALPAMSRADLECLNNKIKEYLGK